MDRNEWAAELDRLAANGNEVGLEANEAKEIAELLRAEPEGDGGTGDN